MINNDILQQFKNLIEEQCGMVITEVHTQQLINYLTEKNKQTGKNYNDLYSEVLSDPEKMTELINAVVVNETYFFREEKQFELLKEYITENFAGKDVVIWSAASSSGEEAYSLASLALACNANPIVYATDIDTDALMQIKKGVYGQNSFRKDGLCFKPYLDKYIIESEDENKQKLYVIKPELKEKINCGRANLVDLDKSIIVPQNEAVDIIFIRNVFIYFDKETRDKILAKLATKLKKDGLLFFSISEIGGISTSDNSIPLVKLTKKSIYYFQKCKEKPVATRTNIQKSENKARLEELMQQHAKETVKGDRSLIKTPTVPSTPAIPSLDAKLPPEKVWEEVSTLTEKKNFSDALKMLENYTPSITLQYIKYYCMGFVYQAQNNKEKAMEFYEKSSISNPRFWPALFQIAALLQNSSETYLERKRHDALIKTATILEDENNESQRYNYVMGSFSCDYFYQLCNEYLKKELR